MHAVLNTVPTFLWLFSKEHLNFSNQANFLQRYTGLEVTVKY